MFTPISLPDFEERTGIRRADFVHLWDSVVRVVSMRAIKTVLGVQAMPRAYLEQLLRSVTLIGDRSCRPYEKSEIRLVRTDPRGVTVGQTFLERRKYLNFLEGFTSIFDGFCLPRGISKITAMIILGRTEQGELVLAHYIPPIVEDGNGGSRNGHRLIDGIHGSFVVKEAGTTIESVVIRGVEAPLPFEPKEWKEVQIVDEKPPAEERLFGSRLELFRDLKFSGIDG